jgi:hypothetical protein
MELHICLSGYGIQFLPVQNIFEDASLSNSDVDRYVIIRNLPRLYFQLTVRTKIGIPEISLNTQGFFLPKGWLLNVF